MPFTFNLYTALLLPCVLQGLLFFTLLLVRGIREENLSDKLLAVLILLFTLRVSNWMLGFAGWYDSHDGFTTFMFYFPMNNFLAIGPLVYFYFRSVTNQNFQFEQKHLWHFLPAALVVLHLTILFFIDIVVQHWWLGQELTGHFGTKGPLLDTGLPGFYALVQFLVPLSIFGYFGTTLWYYQQYRTYIKERFSNTPEIDFSWLRNFLIATLSALVIFLAFRTVDYYLEEGLSYVQYWYSFLAWGIITYYVSIAGYYKHSAQEKLLQFQPASAEIAEEEAPNPQEIAELNRRREQLLQHMEQRQPYLNPGLTLSELADQLHISTAQLSKVINTGLDKNFNDFVNAYRVEAVKAALANPAKSHFSFLSIAYECGFNSKATFNRAFKKHTQQSPSDFLKYKNS